MDINELPEWILENETVEGIQDEIEDMERLLVGAESGCCYDDLLDLIVERHTDFWIAVEGVIRERRTESLKQRLTVLRGGKEDDRN